MKEIFFSIFIISFMTAGNSGYSTSSECTVLYESDLDSAHYLRGIVNTDYDEDSNCRAGSLDSGLFDQVIFFATAGRGYSSPIVDTIQVDDSPIEFSHGSQDLVIGNWSENIVNDITITEYSYPANAYSGSDQGSIIIDGGSLEDGEFPFSCASVAENAYFRNVFIQTNGIYTWDDERIEDCIINVGYAHLCGGEIYVSNPVNHVDEDYYLNASYYNSIKNSLWTPEEEEEEEETGTTSGGSSAKSKSGASKAKVGPVFDITISDISTYNVNLSTSGIYFSASNTSNPDIQITYGPNVAGWCDHDADSDGYKTYDNGDTDNQDCNDWESSIYPGATEYCDGVDNDCDGQVDEDDSNDATTWYKDSDGDGYGDPNDSKTSCSQPSSRYVENNDDCDDDNDDLNPGATEVCDGVDNDCDGIVDEDLTSTTYYYDADEDGYGNSDMSFTDCTEVPEGYVLTGGDCDETDPSINPGAAEICAEEDTVDENCNDVMGCDDSACSSEDYCETVVTPDPEVDVDGDGYPSDEDCDDNDADVNPGMDEVCGNNKDDDCDGVEDEGNTYYFDNDGDSYGDANTTEIACEQPTSYVSDSSDCNDLDGGINPAADEICDNDVDDNCDDLIDEEDTIACPQQTEIEDPEEDVNDDWGIEIRGGSGGCQINRQAGFNLTALFFVLIFLLTMQVARRGKRG